MNGLNIGAHAQAPAGITRAMGSLTGMMTATTKEAQEAFYNELLTHMQEAQQGGFIPSPELICGQVTDRERRRPVISETHKMASAADVTAGGGLAAAIFAGVFPTANDRRFFYADGPLKSSVEGRVLAGLAFEWDVVLLNRFNRHAGNASPGASAPDPVEELRIWTEEELAPLKRILNRATVSLFRNSSNEPGVDAHQLAYYGEGGELIPTSLLPWAYFAQKEAKIVVDTPETYVDIVIPAAAAPRPAITINVNAALTVHGLFVDVDMVPPALRDRMKKASGSK